MTEQRAREIVHDWIRSDACPVVAKMVLLPERIAPLVEAIEQALAAERLAGYRAAKERCARQAVEMFADPAWDWQRRNAALRIAEACLALPDPDPAQETTP